VKVGSALALWLPPLALMALIFGLSDQPDLTTGLGLVDLIGRKIVHLAEYALLCWLWFRALRTRVRPAAAVVAALAISVVYAATDEYHQTFVEGRRGSPVDFAIDTAGAGLVALVFLRRPRRAGPADSSQGS
jgi:TRAP-type uncharacterized transport system fused permease subunit